jgi:hypothetical protein
VLLIITSDIPTGSNDGEHNGHAHEMTLHDRRVRAPLSVKRGLARPLAAA